MAKQVNLSSVCSVQMIILMVILIGMTLNWKVSQVTLVKTMFIACIFSVKLGHFSSGVNFKYRLELRDNDAQ